ncbi:SDR family oxidoreductase [Zavarzinia sp. CC-PAN008]|uniref:SDR family oxidoreductase n=1 Tax=Zavarzinia sp. CC-PAN008 TaxID=3243332 RepID=UPI003F743E43
MPDEAHRGRCYLVTGAASGIGAAVARRLAAGGARVITSDLHGADVIADLTTPAGRAALAEDTAARCGGQLDGVVANAGGGPAEGMIALNFFGAVATLERLHPLLQGSDAGRAVAISSISALRPPEPGIVEDCLAGDEAAAIRQAARALEAGRTGLDLYTSAKFALNQWCRRMAVRPSWAQAGIPLNVVAFGLVETPAAAWVLDNPQAHAAMRAMAPLRDACPGRVERAADLVAWCVSAENALVTGQVLYADGGFECLARGEERW